jgi:hypothetical protein
VPALTSPPWPHVLARPRNLWAAAAVTLVFGAAMLPDLAAMSDRGTGVIPFELARTEDRAAEILDRWGEEGRAAARRSLLLDFGYLLGYGFLLAGLNARVAARALRTGRQSLTAASSMFAWGALLAAGCDAVENLSLYVVASDHPEQPFPGLAFSFAVAKFALLAPAALNAVVGWGLTRRRPA